MSGGSDHVLKSFSMVDSVCLLEEIKPECEVHLFNDHFHVISTIDVGQ